jgi:hypothetical protein
MFSIIRMAGNITEPDERTDPEVNIPKVYCNTVKGFLSSGFT